MGGAGVPGSAGGGKGRAWSAPEEAPHPPAEEKPPSGLSQPGRGGGRHTQGEGTARQRWGGGKRLGLPSPSRESPAADSELKPRSSSLSLPDCLLASGKGPLGHGHQPWGVDMVGFITLAAEVPASPSKEEAPAESWPWGGRPATPSPVCMLPLRQFLRPQPPLPLLSWATLTHPAKPSSRVPASGMRGFPRQATFFPPLVLTAARLSLRAAPATCVHPVTFQLLRVPSTGTPRSVPSTQEALTHTLWLNPRLPENRGPASVTPTGQLSV